MHQRIEALRESLEGTKNRKERVALLNELSRLVRQERPHEALHAASDALRLARLAKDARGTAMANLRLSDYHRHVGELPKAEEYLDVAEGMLDEFPGDHDLHEQVHVARGLLLRMRGEYPGALDAFRRGIEHAGKLENQGRLAEQFGYMGTIYINLGAGTRALEVLQMGLAIAEEMGDDRIAAINLYSLAAVCLQVKDWENALHYLERAVRCCDRGDAEPLKAIVLAKIGGVHMELNRLEEAERYLESAVRGVRQGGMTVALCNALYDMGSCYAKQKRFGEAVRCFREARDLADGLGDRVQRAFTMIGLGNVHLDCGEYDEALECYREVLAIETTPTTLRLHCDTLVVVAEAYEKRGDHLLALETYRRHMELRDEVENLETRQAIATAEMRAELERVEKEREILRLQAEQLRREMEFKERELAAMALQLAQRNELVASLRRRIGSFRESTGANASELANALLPQISQIVNARGEWKAFEEQFHLVHPDFMQKLTERHPDLTPVEVKICSLLRVNLSTKEIASILYASVRTVEWHRRFIRKKLSLPQETNLAIFLASLK